MVDACGLNEAVFIKYSYKLDSKPLDPHYVAWDVPRETAVRSSA